MEPAHEAYNEILNRLKNHPDFFDGFAEYLYTLTKEVTQQFCFDINDTAYYEYTGQVTAYSYHLHFNDRKIIIGYNEMTGSEDLIYFIVIMTKMLPDRVDEIKIRTAQYLFDGENNTITKQEQETPQW